MHQPVLRVAGHFGGADQLVCRGAQEVAALYVLQSPLARGVAGLRHDDEELAPWLALLVLASHVAEGVHCQVLAQVRLEVDGVRLASRSLQGPDLLLLQRRPVGVYLKPELYRC